MEFTDNITSHILIAGIAIVITIALSVVSRKTSIPAPTIFLTAGIVLANLFPEVKKFATPDLIVEIGSWVVVLIIFEAGFSSGFSKFTSSLREVVLLGTIGTILTALGLAVVSHLLLGISLEISILIAVALAPTDPAAVFSVLSGQRLTGRAGKILEGESGANDPVSIALMIGAISFALHPESAGASHIIQELFAEMCVGLVCGIMLGYAGNWVLTNFHFQKQDLLLLALLGIAFITFGITATVGGSGFLAVFVAAMIIGEVPILNNKKSQDLLSAIAGVSELVIFTLLGIVASFNHFSGIALQALILFCALSLVRSGVVFLLLTKSELSRAEKIFITWGGLKGAVPIILAALAVVAAVDGSDQVMAIVFWTVFLSVALQGATLKPLARRLNLIVDDSQDENDALVVDD